MLLKRNKTDTNKHFLKLKKSILKVFLTITVGVVRKSDEPYLEAERYQGNGSDRRQEVRRKEGTPLSKLL